MCVLSQSEANLNNSLWFQNKTSQHNPIAFQTGPTLLHTYNISCKLTGAPISEVWPPFALVHDLYMKKPCV